MYRVVYKKAALKALRRMPKPIRERMAAELERIAADLSASPGNWKPLSGSPYWRLRVGGYRAVCAIEDGDLVLLVLKAGPRGDVCK